MMGLLVKACDIIFYLFIKTVVMQYLHLAMLYNFEKDGEKVLVGFVLKIILVAFFILLSYVSQIM